MYIEQYGIIFIVSDKGRVKQADTREKLSCYLNRLDNSKISLILPMDLRSAIQTRQNQKGPAIHTDLDANIIVWFGSRFWL